MPDLSQSVSQASSSVETNADADSQCNSKEVTIQDEGNNEFSPSVNGRSLLQPCSSRTASPLSASLSPPSPTRHPNLQTLSPHPPLLSQSHPKECGHLRDMGMKLPAVSQQRFNIRRLRPIPLQRGPALCALLQEPRTSSTHLWSSSSWPSRPSMQTVFCLSSAATSTAFSARTPRLLPRCSTLAVSQTTTSLQPAFPSTDSTFTSEGGTWAYA